MPTCLLGIAVLHCAHPWGGVTCWSRERERLRCSLPCSFARDMLSPNIVYPRPGLIRAKNADALPCAGSRPGDFCEGFGQQNEYASCPASVAGAPGASECRAGRGARQASRHRCSTSKQSALKPSAAHLGLWSDQGVACLPRMKVGRPWAPVRFSFVPKHTARTVPMHRDRLSEREPTEDGPRCGKCIASKQDGQANSAGGSAACGSDDPPPLSWPAPPMSRATAPTPRAAPPAAWAAPPRRRVAAKVGALFRNAQVSSTKGLIIEL